MNPKPGHPWTGNWYVEQAAYHANRAPYSAGAAAPRDSILCRPVVFGSYKLCGRTRRLCWELILKLVRHSLHSSFGSDFKVPETCEIFRAQESLESVKSVYTRPREARQRDCIPHHGSWV